MRWGQGFFRAWVLVSALWTGGWQLDLVIAGFGRMTVMEFLAATFAPPIALLAFGLAVAWVLRGFRRDTAGTP